MVTLNIPEDIKLAPDKPEVVTGNPIVTHAEVKFVVPTKTSRIDKEFFLTALDKSIERLEKDPRLQDLQALERAIRILSSPATNRPHVFVAEIIDATAKKPVLDYVNNSFGFRKLLGLLGEATIVDTYCGTDASEVTVIRARLPESYVARVPYVKLRHIPQVHKHKGNVVLKEIGNTMKGQGDRECMHFCEEMFPLWTNWQNRGKVSEEINRIYHYITIKIRNEDGSIKRWNPGLDKAMSPCQSIQDTFVLVGEPYPTRQPVVTPAAKVAASVEKSSETNQPAQA